MTGPRDEPRSRRSARTASTSPDGAATTSVRNCGPRGEERRHDPRVPQLAAARAVQTKPFRSFDCILRDISEGGCRLVGVAIDSIHSPFLLTLPGWPAPRHCEVAWRARKSIGVRFGEWATPADEAAGGRAVTAP